MRWFGRGGRLTPIGLDLRLPRVRAVQLRADGERPGLWAAADFPLGGEAGEGQGQEQGRRIAQVLERRGFAGRQVVVAAPADRLVADVLELPPRSSGAPLEQIAATELARTARMDPAAMELRLWDLPQPARAAAHTTAMAVALRHPDAAALMDALEEAGLEVAAIDAEPCALARACASLIAEPAAITPILEIGWERSSMALLHQGVLIYHRSIMELAISAVPGAIAERLGIEPAAAGCLLDTFLAGGSDQPPVAELRDAVTQALARIADESRDEIHASIAYAGHRYPSAPAGAMLVCGDGAGLGGLVQRLEEGLGMPVTLVDPAQVVHVGGGESDTLTPAMLLAMGLAMHPGEAL